MQLISLTDSVPVTVVEVFDVPTAKIYFVFGNCQYFKCPKLAISAWYGR